MPSKPIANRRASSRENAIALTPPGGAGCWERLWPEVIQNLTTGPWGAPSTIAAMRLPSWEYTATRGCSLGGDKTAISRRATISQSLSEPDSSQETRYFPSGETLRLAMRRACLGSEKAASLLD